MKHILIFDENVDNQSFYTQLCKPIEITFDYISSYQEFKHQHYEDYAAVLVRGKFSDERFASDIERQVSGRSTLIAVADRLLTSEQLRFLKEVEKIPFVFIQNIENYELKSALGLLPNNQVSDEGLYKEIKERFDKTIFEKLQIFEKDYREIKESFSMDKLSSFQHYLLSLSEIAYAHDYFIVSHLCHSMSLEIHKWSVQAHSSKETLQKLFYYFISKIEGAVQLNGIGENMELEISENVQHVDPKWVDIYLIDQPDHWQQIQKWAEGCGISLAFLSPHEALQAKTDLSAKLGLLRQEKGESGQKFLHRFKDLHKKFQISDWGVVDFRGSVADRLEAMKSGANFFIEKDSAPQELIDHLNSLLLPQKKKKESSKSLFIRSNEHEFLGLIQSGLAGLNYICEKFASEDSLFKEMESRPPDFLILNQEPPDHDAIHLMKLIHADFRFKQIPILIVSGVQERVEIDKCQFGENEDWMAIPFSIPSLLSKISSPIKRHESLLASQSHDPDTQVYTPIKFREHFNPLPTAYTLALVEINIDAISNRFGKEKSDDVLFQIGRLLNNFFAPNEKIVRWRENQFVVIFDEHDVQVEQVDYLMKACVQKIQKTFFVLGDTETPLYANYALSTSPKEGLSLDDLYFVTAHKLKESETIKDNPSSSEAAEVMLIDPDKDLLQLLDESLKLRSLKTCLAKNGNEALNLLKNRGDAPFPSLIVLERLLEDMDGIEMIARFKRMFPDKKSSFWFLTARSSEEDILSGLKEGAMDYLAKPFNLTLLTEKISNSLKNPGVPE